MKNKYVFFFYIIILIISSTKLVAYGNNLGFGYSDYGCTLSVDRKLYCNRKGLKGLIYINDLPEDLEHLYLNDNNITSIQKETFDKSKKLRRLYLNNNKILNFQAKTFQYLENLLLLDISNNKINTLERNAFSGLISVVEINVDQNPITSPMKKCHSNTFLKQKLLSFESGSKITIYICEQKFTQCHEKTGCKHSDNPDSCIFDQITKTFDCTGGGYSGKIYLTSIPDRTNSLILKNNFITELNPKTFQYLDNLYALDISNNLLEFLDKDIFNKLTKLKTLSLANNPILSDAKENRTSCKHNLNLVEISIESRKYKWYNCDETYNIEEDNSKKELDQLSSGSSVYYCSDDVNKYIVLIYVFINIFII